MTTFSHSKNVYKLQMLVN